MLRSTSTLSKRIGSRTPVSRAQSAMRRRPSSSGTVGCLAEDAAQLRVVRECVDDLLPRRQESISGSATPKARRDRVGEVDDGVRRVGADVEHLVRGFRDVDRARDQRRDVVDVGERPRLQAVAEDRHRPAAQQLVHEDPDHVAVRVRDVLQLAVDVVRPEDRVVEAEHPLRGGEVELDGVLRDPVRVLRLGDDVLGHGRLPAAVDGDRARRRRSARRHGADRRVDEVDRSRRRCSVVEALG